MDGGAAELLETRELRLLLISLGNSICLPLCVEIATIFHDQFDPGCSRAGVIWLREIRSEYLHDG